MRSDERPSRAIRPPLVHLLDPSVSLLLRSTFFVLAGALLTLSFSSPLYSQDSTRYFYKGLTYGSQANFSPLSVVMNGSFDILQVSNRNNRIFDLRIASGMRNVWENVTRPSGVISQYGWGRFIRTEVFPTSIRLESAQYWPNYQLHLIGGGITYVATAEWYEFHGFAYPYTMSALTMAAYHYLNEAIETQDYRGPNVDPIADLLIFDPLGIALFSVPGVARFFSETLHAADWSFQPMINVHDRTLINNGQNYSYKLKLPFVDRWKIFYFNGMEGGIGLSYMTTETDHLSFSGGYSARNLVHVENNTGVRTLTTTLIRTFALFYDRNNSLLSSLIIGGARGYKVRFNVYPGLVGIGRLLVGGALMMDRGNRLILGVMVSLSPVGVSSPIGL